VMRAVRIMLCQRCRVRDRFWPGSSMTPDFPRRVAFRRGGPTILRTIGETGQLPVRRVVSVATLQASLAGGVSALSAPRMGRGSRPPDPDGIPEEIAFQTKPEIALEQLSALTRTDTPEEWYSPMRATVTTASFAGGVRHLNLSCVLGIHKSTKVWRRARNRCLHLRIRAVGGPQSCRAAVSAHSGECFKAAQDLPNNAYQTIVWREAPKRNSHLDLPPYGFGKGIVIIGAPTASGRMVADRVAREGSGTHKILALQPGGGRFTGRIGSYGQAAVAH